MIRLQIFSAPWAPPPPKLPASWPQETIDADTDPEALERLGLKGLPAVVARGEEDAVLGCLLGSADDETVVAWLEGLAE